MKFVNRMSGQSACIRFRSSSLSWPVYRSKGLSLCVWGHKMLESGVGL